MSVSTALSSAKRRRAGNVQDLQNTVESNVDNQEKNNGARMMPVQQVLYMFHHKMAELNARIDSMVGLDNGDLMTQVTDSIDNMNNTLEEFSVMIKNVEARLANIEHVTKLADKVSMLEKRVNEKILMRTAEKKTDKSKSVKENKMNLDKLVADKPDNTVDKKFNDKREQLKVFEEKQQEGDTNNVEISFSGLKDKIETNTAEVNKE